MTSFKTPIISQPGAGRMAQSFGSHLIRISAEDSAGCFGLFEGDVPPGEGPPLHIHEREEEFFRVLSGRFLFICGDTKAEVGEGGCVLLPRGIAHRFQNIGTTTGRLMIIVTPGGFEGFFGAVDQAGPAGLPEVSARYGLRFVGMDAGQQAA